MPEFVLQVQDLEGSGKDYAFSVRPAWAEGALKGSELRIDASVPATLAVHASKSGADVVVRGKLQGRLLTECSRCLGDAPLPVDTEITALYQARGADFRPDPDEADLTPEDLDREYYTGNEIALDDIVRETMLLELPMQPLCAETCEGIPIPDRVRPPADFGKQQGVTDPRFAALKNVKLSNQKSKKE